MTINNKNQVSIKNYICSQDPNHGYEFLNLEFSIRFLINFIGEVTIEPSIQLNNYLNKHKRYINVINTNNNNLTIQLYKKSRNQSHNHNVLDLNYFLYLLKLYNNPLPTIELTDKGYILKNNSITIRFSLIKNTNWCNNILLISPFYKNEILPKYSNPLSNLRNYTEFIDYRNSYEANTLIKSLNNNNFNDLYFTVNDIIRKEYNFFIKNPNFNLNCIFDNCLNYNTLKISYKTFQNKLKSKINNSTIGFITEVSIYKYFYDLHKELIKKYPKAEHIIKTVIDYEIGFKNNSLQVEIVSGYQLQKYYSPKFLELKGELGNSCMNYSNTDKNYSRIQFYAENSDVVKLAIIKGVSGKIVCRALLWKTVCGQTIMDRIYYTDPVLCNTMFKFCTTNNIKFIYNERYRDSNLTRLINNPTSLSASNFSKYYVNKYNIQLSFLHENDKKLLKSIEKSNRIYIHGNNYFPEIQYIPYLDNFNCFDVDNMTISNFLLNETIEARIYVCDYTATTSTNINEFVRTYEDLLCHVDSVVQLRNEEYAWENDSDIVYSKHHDCYNFTDNMVYSNFMEDWISAIIAVHNEDVDDFYLIDDKAEFEIYHDIKPKETIKKELIINSSLEEGEFDIEYCELPF